MIKFFNLCDVWDTIQGIVFLSLVIQLLDKTFDQTDSDNFYTAMPRWFFRIIEISTYIMDIIDISAIF